jgi:hypothetical protein
MNAHVGDNYITDVGNDWGFSFHAYPGAGYYYVYKRILGHWAEMTKFRNKADCLLYIEGQIHGTREIIASTKK